jgi:hypothetical protein
MRRFPATQVARIAAQPPGCRRRPTPFLPIRSEHRSLGSATPKTWSRRSGLHLAPIGPSTAENAATRRHKTQSSHSAPPSLRHGIHHNQPSTIAAEAWGCRLVFSRRQKQPELAGDAQPPPRPPQALPAPPSEAGAAVTAARLAGAVEGRPGWSSCWRRVRVPSCRSAQATRGWRPPKEE